MNLKSIYAVLAIFALCGSVAKAQMPMPAQMVLTVPTEMREPVQRFLSRMDFKEPAGIVARAKFWDIQHANALLFRFEHAKTCDKELDNCLTVIGRLERGELVAMAMFAAGGKVTVGDNIVRSNGDDGPLLIPHLFFSRHSVVTAHPTEVGWIVTFQDRASSGWDKVSPPDKN